MFKAGKGLKCLANNARISVKTGKKNTLNNFIRKLDKTEGSRPGSSERSAHDLLEIHQPRPDEQGD